MTPDAPPFQIPLPWQEWTSPDPKAPASLKVWMIHVDGDPVCRDAETVLSEAEQLRAGRFIKPLLARRYAAAHAALRRLLAVYLGLRPQDLRFGEFAGGKPVLLDGGSGTECHFNLSHSGPWALVGIAQGLSIGVDIEEVVSHKDVRLVAAEILGPSELSSFREVPPDQQAEALIRIWTAKEACLKALGTGLAIHPKRLACRLTSGAGVAFELDGRPLTVPYGWNMTGPAYSASIVAHSPSVNGSADFTDFSR